MSDAAPLIEMRGIVKSLPGVQALLGVNLNLHTGEMLSLIVENVESPTPQK